MNCIGRNGSSLNIFYTVKYFTVSITTKKLENPLKFFSNELRIFFSLSSGNLARTTEIINENKYCFSNFQEVYHSHFI